MNNSLFLIHAKPTEIRLAFDLISRETGEKYSTRFCDVSEIDAELQKIDRSIFEVENITIANNYGKAYKKADTDGNFRIATAERRA